MTVLKLIIFLQFATVVMSTNVNVGSMEKRILDQIFSPLTYDKRIRPRANNTGTSQNVPTNVTVTMHIISLTFPNEEKQSYGLDIYFREAWLDERLKYDNIIGRQDNLIREVTLNSVENLWIPDTFFWKEIKGTLHSITTPNVFVRISPDGQVFMSMRLNLQVSAEYNYQKFPFDTQQLQLQIESYGYKTDSIYLLWKQDDAVTISSNLQLPLFCVDKLETTNKIIRAPSGEYSTLKLQITVSRKLNYYLLQVFIPCTMLVIAGYLSFWLDIKFITGRIILSASTLYTLALLQNNLNFQLPKVSYTRLIDTYTGVSMTFVFATLVELVLAQAYENSRCRNSSNEEQDQNSHVKSFNVKHVKQWLKSTPLNKVDAIFRLAYPIAFLVFIILYITFIFV